MTQAIVDHLVDIIRADCNPTTPAEVQTAIYQARRRYNNNPALSALFPVTAEDWSAVYDRLTTPVQTEFTTFDDFERLIIAGKILYSPDTGNDYVQYARLHNGEIVITVQEDDDLSDYEYDDMEEAFDFFYEDEPFCVVDSLPVVALSSYTSFNHFNELINDDNIIYMSDFGGNHYTQYARKDGDEYAVYLVESAVRVIDVKYPTAQAAYDFLFIGNRGNVFSVVDELPEMVLKHIGLPISYTAFEDFERLIDSGKILYMTDSDSSLVEYARRVGDQVVVYLYNTGDSDLTTCPYNDTKAAYYFFYIGFGGNTFTVVDALPFEKQYMSLEYFTLFMNDGVVVFMPDFDDNRYVQYARKDGDKYVVYIVQNGKINRYLYTTAELAYSFMYLGNAGNYFSVPDALPDGIQDEIDVEVESDEPIEGISLSVFVSLMAHGIELVFESNGTFCYKSVRQTANGYRVSFAREDRDPQLEHHTDPADALTVFMRYHDDRPLLIKTVTTNEQIGTDLSYDAFMFILQHGYELHMRRPSGLGQLAAQRARIEGNQITTMVNVERYFALNDEDQRRCHSYWYALRHGCTSFVVALDSVDPETPTPDSVDPEPELSFNVFVELLNHGIRFCLAETDTHYAGTTERINGVPTWTVQTTKRPYVHADSLESMYDNLLIHMAERSFTLESVSVHSGRVESPLSIEAYTYLLNEGYAVGMPARLPYAEQWTWETEYAEYARGIYESSFTTDATIDASYVWFMASRHHDRIIIIPVEDHPYA